MNRPMHSIPRHLCFASMVSISLLFYLMSCTVSEINYLDPTFGTQGKVSTDFSSRLDEAYALALQGDGKIVVGGRSKGTTWDFALARYNTDGTLDTGFNTTGMVTTDFSVGHDTIRALAIQSDNKIVAAGSTVSARLTTTYALARYNTDGSLDTTFGTNGLVTASLGESDSESFSIQLQSDGKILAAGTTKAGGYFNFALARFDTVGALDSDFDTDGKVTLSFANQSDARATAVSLQSDGKIILSGYTTVSQGNRNFATARYSTTGNLDTLFGTSGKVSLNLGSLVQGFRTTNSDDYAKAMKVDSHDNICIAGYSLIGSDQYLAMAQLNSSGQLQTLFSGTGALLTLLSGYTAYGEALALGSTSLTIAGYVINSLQRDVALTRYSTYGNTDPTFGNSGTIISDYDSSSDEAYAIAVDSSGKTVVAGHTTNGLDRDFLLLRYER